MFTEKSTWKGSAQLGALKVVDRRRYQAHCGRSSFKWRIKVVQWGLWELVKKAAFFQTYSLLTLLPLPEWCSCPPPSSPARNGATLDPLFYFIQSPPSIIGICQFPSSLSPGCCHHLVPCWGPPPTSGWFYFILYSPAPALVGFLKQRHDFVTSHSCLLIELYPSEGAEILCSSAYKYDLIWN